MIEREGPIWTDERGELDFHYKTCRGCKHLRVHDFHYFYCRAYGDQSKPDFDPYNKGMKRIWHGLEPLPECDRPAARPDTSPALPRTEGA